MVKLKNDNKNILRPAGFPAGLSVFLSRKSVSDVSAELSEADRIFLKVFFCRIMTEFRMHKFTLAILLKDIIFNVRKIRR